MALLPYLVIIAVFSLAKLWTPVKTFLVGTDLKVTWPGLDGHVLTVAGKVSTTTAYTLPWLSSPGSLLFLSGVLVAVLYRIAPATAVREFGAVLFRLRWALLTVTSVLALAYVMNLSGQTITVGAWIAGTGAAFAFLSPILGWLGTAVTGSDTSANALFATMQQAAGVEPHHRRHRGRPDAPGGCAVPADDPVEPGAAVRAVCPGVPTVHGPLLDAALTARYRRPRLCPQPRPPRARAGTTVATAQFDRASGGRAA
jgi:hypothetical protein